MAAIAAVKETAEAIKATTEAIKTVVDFMEDAARSVVCEVNNVTSVPLVYEDSGHDHGGFRETPSGAIQPRATGLFGSRSKAFSVGTGTEGWVRYRLDSEGTSLIVMWDNPYAGSNECSAKVEGPHADWYATVAISGAGDKGAHQRFIIGEMIAGADRQADWRFCNRCFALFFGPADGNCPSGGAHFAQGLVFRIPHDVPGPLHQAAWRYCDQCAVMFFDGYDDKGVCPGSGPNPHEAVGWNYLIPNREMGASPSSGQDAWRHCGKCRTLFHAGDPKDLGVCTRGGAHEIQGWEFVLPNAEMGAPPSTGQPGWSYCGNCRSLFYNGDPNNQGNCPKGGPHQAVGWHFLLPNKEMGAAPTTGQEHWRFCGKCMSVFYNGDSANRGACPGGGPTKHQPAGYQFFLPHAEHDRAAGQDSWRYCTKCHVLFFAGYDPDLGVCRAGGGHLAQGFNFRLEHL
ncbi:hypothetical protein ACFQ6S_41860 [Streptomyces sp. NPDC056479]|uniref:hypothetical protein n=1 Tax=Streptomyces sp. NPDC056479 TaxID=3345832 RepID=UPI0036848CE3